MDVTEEPSERSDVVTNDALVRTHLANERTFLAWLRTAVVMVGAGLGAAVIAEGSRAIHALALAMGATAAVGGCVLVVWALNDYRRNVGGINGRSFRPANRLPVVATALTIALALGALGLAVLELVKE